MTPIRFLTAALLAAALLFTAFSASAQSFYAEEIKATETVLRANPTSLNNHQRLATLHYLAGVAWGESGYVDRAQISAENAVLILSNASIPISNPIYQSALYASAYFKWENGKPNDALIDLDVMLSASPNNFKALYLKGVVLVGAPAKGNWKRAMEAFAEAGNVGDEAERAMAARSANRLAYNASTLDHAIGKPDVALATLSTPTYSFGLEGAGSEAENRAVLYAEGAYTYDASGALGGMTVFEDLYEVNPSFTLNNGVALRQILSDAYYAAALELLAQKNVNTAPWALTLLDKSGALGDDADVNLHHARAVAYKILGNQPKLVEAMEIIQVLDSERYDAINTAM